ncbi:MAG TPA: MarR family winged helix-turn-helix transcriptional regulator, partial [Lachnospiraceae bacterium]|nr:MarR family winged helix-turn-helix transcriptional regulator [Lachnospiraceae bacterium]
INLQKLERNILREIGTITRCINSISDMTYKDIHLQKGQFIYLIRVCETPGVNQIDLSNLLKVDKTTTTKAIQKLIKEGYIERRWDSTDKRIWRLYPLPRALNAYEFITNRENLSNKYYFNDFQDGEAETLLNLLAKLRRSIETDWVKGKKERKA